MISLDFDLNNYGVNDHACDVGQSVHRLLRNFDVFAVFSFFF